MKKIILLIMLLFSFLLVGCGSAKITTINPDTGEKETYKIKETDNEDEVIDTLYNMLMSDVKIDNYQTESIDISFKVGIDGEFKVDLEGNVNFKGAFEKDSHISNLKDMIDFSTASGKIDVNGTFSNGSEEKKIELDMDLFLEKGTIYFKPSMNLEAINTLTAVNPQVSETVKLLNDSWLKYNINEVLPKEYLELDVAFSSDETIADILKDNNISTEDLRTIIENIVKEYNLTISNVKKNVVTFKALVNDIASIELSINTKTMSVVNAKISFEEEVENNNISVEVDAKISYKASVEKISEENKLKAVDLGALIETFTASNDIASIDELIEQANKFRYIQEYEQISQGIPNFEVPAGGYDGSEVTIVFYHAMGSRLIDVLNMHIEEFNKKYPNIHIEHMQVGGYEDVRNMISTELLSGTSPNVAVCYPDDVVIFNKSNSVVVLDPLAFSGESDSAGGMLALGANNDYNIIDGDEGRRFGDGQLYTLPLSKSSDVMYYNKTFFEAHNIPVPDHWFSTDENDTTSMEAVIKAIKLIDPRSIPLACVSESNLFINMCAQIGSEYLSAGANHYLFNNRYNKGFMKVFHDWYQNGYFTTQSLCDEYISGLFVNTDEYETKCYISIASSAIATHMRPSKVDNKYPFEVGIKPIPQMSERYSQILTQDPSLCIFNKDNPQEVIASWLFVRYLVTSLDFQADYSMVSGYMPVLRNIKENGDYKSFLDRANGYDFVQALANKICLEPEWSYFTPSVFDGSAHAKVVLKDLFIRVLRSNDAGNFGKTLDRLFKNAEDECN